MKHLASAKDGRYKMLHKSDDNRNGDMEREKEKVQALWSVAQRLEEEGHGILSHKLSSLSNILKSKMQKIQAKEIVA